MNKVSICYFRSLYSQSACSLSIGKLSDYLLNRGYETHLFLLKNDSQKYIINNYNQIMKSDVIVYKTNYKDFEYGIRLFENLLFDKNKKFYLVGPFAIMNKKEILKKYSFIDGIINIQDNNEIDSYFVSLNNKIRKNTIIKGIDREIEFQEKGRYINIESSTGCIYNCAFCHIKLMEYSKSEKSMNLVVDEIEELYNKLGKRYFIFNDSVFWKNSSDNTRINEFIDLIKKKQLKISFMIYLSLTVKIESKLLKRLQEIGLIRIFFGVENISKDFSIQNNKYVSETDTELFIKELDSLNISYHIGFILFSKETKYSELKKNIDFLYKIKKLFRPGILVEKMRILPNSKESIYLLKDNSKIDQAYNYIIDDKKVENYYQIINLLFSNINIRNFEQFFSGINISLTIIKNQGKSDKYAFLEDKYFETLELINDGVYEILINELNSHKITSRDIEKLKDLYAIAEVNYIRFMDYLKNNDKEIYETIPHGTEDLNIW